MSISGADTPDFERLSEIEEQIKGWDPKSRAEAMKHLSAMDDMVIQAWYCTRGRKCDGQPHGEYQWKHARGDQWPPPGEDWFVWACMAGRGWGKTRTGAEYTRAMSEKVGRMALVAPTASDARDTMIDGESGLLQVCARAGMKVLYEPSKKRVTFPSGARATLFSGEEPDRLRGPQHGFAWLDEPAHMPLIDEVWTMLLLGLRLPPRPHVIVTTTPKPIKWVRTLVDKPNTRVVKGKTHDNLSNLAQSYQDEVMSQYEGTRMGRQELYGDILEDVEGALWQAEWLSRSDREHTEMERIVIAIDPAGTSNKKSDETGIVTAGKLGKQGFVLRDDSGRMTPQEWAKKAMKNYEELQADAIVVETNFGGDMVKENLRHNGFEGRVIESRAVRGKQLRAEPIVTLYEQGRMFHNGPNIGQFDKLEEEMLTWVPGEGASPNRVDALVWAMTDLMKPGGEMTFASPLNLPGSRNPLLGASRRENPITALRRRRTGY